MTYVNDINCEKCAHKDVCKYIDVEAKTANEISKKIREMYPFDQSPYRVNFTCDKYKTFGNAIFRDSSTLCNGKT